MKLRPSCRLFALTLGLLFLAPPAFADGGVGALEKAREQYRSGHWDEAAANFERAYAGAAEDSVGKAEAALEWGSLLWEQGRYNEAEAKVKDALERARVLKLDSAIGQLLLTLGHIEASKGQLRQAESTLTICVRMAGEEQDRTFQALCRINRRHVRTLRGQSPGSEAEFRADIAALEQAGTPLSVGTSLSKTAELFHTTGDLNRAMELFERAGQHFNAAGSVPAQARNRLRIAQLMQDQGRWDEARAQLDGLVGQFEVMGNRPLLVNALGSMARDAQRRGDVQQAHALYRRALNTARETRSPQLIARGHLALCELGQEPTHCVSAAKFFGDTGIPALQARAKGQLARHHQAQNEFVEARGLYIEVIEILEKQVVGSSRDESSLVSQYANLCQVELNLGATGSYGRCRDALRKMEAMPKTWQEQNQGMLASTHYAIGVSAVQGEQLRPAMEHLEKAAQITMEMTPPNRSLAAQALLRLGVVQGRLQAHRDKAENTFERGLAASEGPELLAMRVQHRTQLAQLQLNRSNWSAAVGNLEALVTEAREAKDPKSGAWAYSGLGRALLQQGKRDEAKKALQAGLPLARQSGDAEMVELFEGNLKQFD